MTPKEEKRVREISDRLDAATKRLSNTFERLESLLDKMDEEYEKEQEGRKEFMERLKKSPLSLD